jgi:hypothetical protein
MGMIFRIFTMISKSTTMITQTMVQPSFWVATGIKMSKVHDPLRVSRRDRYLFKFSDELQSKLDELSQQKKLSPLTEGEEAELEGILELGRIFTLLNAKIIAEG